MLLILLSIHPVAVVDSVTRTLDSLLTSVPDCWVGLGCLLLLDAQVNTYGSYICQKLHDVRQKTDIALRDCDLTRCIICISRLFQCCTHLWLTTYSLHLVERVTQDTRDSDRYQNYLKKDGPEPANCILVWHTVHTVTWASQCHLHG